MRDVNLVSYLPPFMAGFKELTAALDAENPEFVLLWIAIDRVFQNMFIETADEYGLSRLEGVLGILPTPADTLESRRQRLRGSYTSDLPYTERKLKEILESMCGKGNFTLIVQPEKGVVAIKLRLAAERVKENIEAVVGEIIPAGMLLDVVLIYNRWSRFSRLRWDDVKTETWKSVFSAQKWQEGEE